MNYTDHKLKELLTHGTVTQPYSYHHTIINADIDCVLYNHWHEELELVYMAEGEATFYVEGREFNLAANEALLIPTAFLHQAMNTYHNTCEFYALVFRPEFIAVSEQASLYSSYVLPILSANALSTYHFSSKANWEKQVCAALSQMSLFYTGNTGENELAIKGLLLVIWQLLFTYYLPEHQLTFINSKMMERLQTVLEYIDVHLIEDMTLEELSCIACVGKEQFCRTFKRVMGTTPFVWINRKRLQKACLLLTTTNKKITDIATLSGFNNISYFNRSFQKQLTCTPHEYRLRMSK